MKQEPSPQELAQLDYELALNAVAGVSKKQGYEIAGGEKNKDASYSLVLQNADGYTAVKITTIRAPEQPAYTPTEVDDLRRFAARNGIPRCAMAPVGLWPAELDEDGRQGFYVNYKGLVQV
jgi:hypothetical protein